MAPASAARTDRRSATPGTANGHLAAGQIASSGRPGTGLSSEASSTLRRLRSALAPFLAAARHYESFAVQKCAASRPAEKSADGVQRLHLTRRRPLSYLRVGNRRSARARLQPSGVPNLRKAGRQFRDGPGNPRKDGESPAARAGAGADRGRLFFSRHQLLTATYTTYTRYTRPARSGDAPGNSGSWRGGRCKIARTQAARARRRELPDSRQ